MHFSVLEAHTGNSTLRVRNSEARSGGQSNTRASSQLSARNEFVVPDLTGLTYQHSGSVRSHGWTLPDQTPVSPTSICPSENLIAYRVLHGESGQDQALKQDREWSDPYVGHFNDLGRN
jgi:hypothetical protein